MENVNGDYFCRCSDADFWKDKARVKTLIDLYRDNECLWNVQQADYKNVTKKKAAKTAAGKHFSMTGLYCRVTKSDEEWVAYCEGLRRKRVVIG